jgi:hypothetical protein
MRRSNGENEVGRKLFDNKIIKNMRKDSACSSLTARLVFFLFP